MIRFKSVKFRNFNSVGNNAVEISLDENQKTLFTGSNGAGKSTISDAVVYALFGKPFRKCKVAELVNDATNKKCEVDLTFELNGKEYRIFRGQKPKRFEIYIDDELFEEDGDYDAREYQKKLETIIGVNYKTFVQVYILGNASFTAFMRLDAADRRSVVDNVFDTHILVYYSKILLSMKKANVKEKQELEHQKELIEQKCEIKRQQLDKLSTDNQGIIEEKEVEKSSIEKHISQKIELRDKIKSNIDKKGDKKLEKIPELERNLRKLGDFKIKIQSKVTSRNKVLEFLEENDICPTCDQNIDKNFKKQKTKNLFEKNKEADDGIHRLMQEIKKVKDEIEELRQFEKKFVDLQSELNRVEQDLKNDQSLLQRVEKEIEKLSKSSSGEQIKLKEEIDQYKGEVKALDKEIEKKKKIGKHYDAMTKMLKDDGIKSVIIKRFVPYMNKRANHYLEKLNFHIKFYLDENFNESIIRTNGKQVNYFSLSEGEKARVDLAVLFMWRDVIKKRSNTFCNLLILDEIFDSSIDMDGSDDLMGLLDDLSKESRVIVISHKGDILFDKFSSHIHFEKVNGFSKIV